SLFPYTTLFRSRTIGSLGEQLELHPGFMGIRLRQDGLYRNIGFLVESDRLDFPLRVSENNLFGRRFLRRIFGRQRLDIRVRVGFGRIGIGLARAAYASSRAL